MSRWKVGDTKPDLVIDCFDSSGVRPDFTDVTALKVRAYRHGVLVWERDVTGDSNGTVTMLLQASDTATAGTFKVKVFAQWPDGAKQHYPPADQYMTMTVTR